MKALWISTIIGAIIGGLFMVGGLLSASGSPQEAAAGAVGAAFAVIPYCLARAASELKAMKRTSEAPPTTGGDRHMVPEPATKPPPKVRCVSCGYALPLKDLKPGGVVPCPHCGVENKLSALAPGTGLASSLRSEDPPC